MLPLILSSLLSPAAVAAVSVGGTAPRPRSVVTRGEGFIHVTVNPISNLPALRRRQEEVGVINQRTGTSYAIDIGIGTPPQTVTLILDTGSPDLWVNPTCQTANVPRECAKFPVYDWSQSSTVEGTGYADVLTYGKGNATVEYVTDTITIGSLQITSQIFGINLESHDIPLGILGLSPPLVAAEQAYPFVLDTMAAQGVIKSRAFSLDLRSVTSPTGAIIFGGLDKGKFAGPLVRLPILDPAQTPRGVDRYYVALTGVGITFPDGTQDRSEEIAVAVFLDSGGTLSRLPAPIFHAFGQTVPTSQFDTESGFYVVDCAIGQSSGSADFFFENGLQIAVPYNDFIWHLGPNTCVLGIQPTAGPGDEPVLGDSFLRAAYVVHDQDNRALHLAQAADCGTNIVSIGSGRNAVPSATGDCKVGPRPTAVAGGSPLDTDSDRKPTKIYTGSSPAVTGIDGGPGPAGGRSSTTAAGIVAPTPGRSGASRGLGLSLGLCAVVALVTGAWAL